MEATVLHIVHWQLLGMSASVIYGLGSTDGSVQAVDPTLQCPSRLLHIDDAPKVLCTITQFAAHVAIGHSLIMSYVYE